MECYAFGQVTILSRTAANNATYLYHEMRQIMEEYGKVKQVRIKRDRYDYQQPRAIICFSNEKETVIAIKETNKYKRWKSEEYKNVSEDQLYSENNNNECNLKKYQKHKSHEKQWQNSSEINNNMTQMKIMKQQ